MKLGLIDTSFDHSMITNRRDHDAENLRNKREAKPSTRTSKCLYSQGVSPKNQLGSAGTTTPILSEL